MANEKKYTPEVERLLLAARGLYEAAARAKLTAGLAVALRDGIVFDKLQDPELLALCQFVKELEKLDRPAEAPVEATPAEGANGAAVATVVSKPDDKKNKGGKGSKGADPAA
jgi:hypothetical protein